MTTSPLSVNLSIDDILGPGENRFFGSGYRRVVYDLSEIEVTSTEDGFLNIEASIGLSYPGTWSKKKDGKERLPHFSTLDALILGAEIAELGLARSHGWTRDSEELAQSWIRRIHISAGSKPQEELDSLKALVTRKAIPELVTEQGFRVSVFHCKMGSMRVRLEIAHPEARSTEGTWSYHNRTEAVSPPETRYYGDGFKAWRHEINQVEVDVTVPSARGSLQVVPINEKEAQESKRYGLESAYESSISLLDLLVAASQLTQAVLYDFDGIPRAQSDTLWMRRTTVTAEYPHRPSNGEGIDIHARLVNPDRIVLGNDTWSTTDVQGEANGVSIESSIAHRVQQAAHSPEAPQPEVTEQKENG